MPIVPRFTLATKIFLIIFRNRDPLLCVILKFTNLHIQGQLCREEMGIFNYVDTYMKKLYVIGWFLLTVFTACQSDSTHSYEVDILDEKGQPTAARVRVTGLDGNYIAPSGHEVDFPITEPNTPAAIEKDVLLDEGRKFAYVEGKFDIHTSESVIHMEVVKGFHYGIYDDTLDISKTNKKIEIPLQTFMDVPDESWYSGDVHVHHINSESAFLEMQAEDLNVCNILISDFTIDHDRFRGEIEPSTDSNHIIYYGQEFREDRLGHVNLLNIKERLVEPSKEKRSHQYPLNMYAYDQIHDYGGHLSWAHFAAWPGLEGPLAAVLQKVDAVELLCTIDPFHEPIFADDIVPEVQMNPGLRLWYRLLNCGLRLPITGGTDKMNNQVTVGANRVYAKLEGDFTYEHWINALNEGKTFVSNGPFILFDVDGHEPGDELMWEGQKTYKLRAEVWSQLPIDRLEIVANGEVIAEKQISKDEQNATLEIDYVPHNSVWVAARAYQLNKPDARSGVSFAQRRDAGGGPTLFNRYFGTLRPQNVFSHTSPIYITNNKQPIRSTEDAAYFIHYLDNAMKWLDSAGSFPSDEAKAEVLEAFRIGKRAFKDLMP